MCDWLESDGTIELCDACGTPISECQADFSGYLMPFDTGETLDDLTPPPSGLELMGDDGVDVLLGDGGRDFLLGQDGRDEITGGIGNDVLIGGGTDLFIFDDGWGDDRIVDFDASSTGDVVVLRDVGAITDFADLAAHHMTRGGR